ncbi:MAG TPA: DNA-binding protein YbiB [Ottowia sp.]|jgi:anthranilate phosphoribosyltransferase|nr:MAG: DNA-binding protein YbiB [Burkholderiales bacterium 68-10]HMT63522.1 DNA-binding protein YbiB [Ottowia sp.]HMT81878.1 DNA-binding protein YbiB [Ottowia sp.]HOM19816.1 DNA-binding protein YbiB [Ottowia sp.]HON29860.1 DNA-binding protein YbiB [Ottowia sp.]
MSISSYIKIIGRAAPGAQPLSREQAADLMGQVLDGSCTDLEIGAFCVAMRIKGETPEEMAGFLDAVHARMNRLPASDRPVVVLPSYNGARRLPVLTPLLALMLARKGLPVLLHGASTEDGRVTSRDVLAQLGIGTHAPADRIASGRVHVVPTERLLPGLKRLLDARRAIGLRNTGHALVKMMNPIDGPALVVTSYTHPEYAASMATTFDLFDTAALLLRGTEGEPVADARRTPRMVLVNDGVAQCVQEAQVGPLTSLPRVPTIIDAATTADFTRAVMEGRLPAPAPVTLQVEHIVRACKALEAAYDPTLLQPLVTPA